MDLRTILAISANKTDHLILADCLDRAEPRRFRLNSNTALERPLDTLMDPAIDAVILAAGPETDYLLRLAQKHVPSLPIILLRDNIPDSEQLRQLRDSGAQDYLVRGQLQDPMLHRLLDYSIELKQARTTISELSSRDALTGTLNRAGFRAHLERAMQRSQRYRFKTALLYLNVDQFTNINDHYGEQNGDAVIQALSQRMLSKLRSSDSIARLGGDEFAVVLEDVGAPADMARIADKMLQAIAAPYYLEGQHVAIDASIGGALFADDAANMSELMDHARSAMLQAKAIPGCRFVAYSDHLQFDMQGSSTLAAELRVAARHNQFELHYQPRMDLERGRLAGLEALLRWNHPQRGLICPGEFIAECEDMGLMKTIGYQVIQHACCALNWLGDQRMDDVVVAVNISFSQIQDDRFIAAVKDTLQRTGANPARLEFELTETTILKDPAAIKASMHELMQLGIRFSLDDFGTGFSQLTHLTELPISAIKVDAAFVRDLPHNVQQAAVCSLIIEMARRLDIEVIAEGVENHEQVTFLRSQNCEQVQGFYYSKAIPLQQLPRFVQEQRFKQRERISS
ncbi:MAG: bifunctional diguanylate cyclase/phosphodiesterase [Halieaceae bacterium]|uniref:putative bifunctional diguanylate cyclase/phosphodiesterase n=1 Tax=Haliea alexandrii TaxID=2448162 RepID=UPI000F0B6FAE|nr:bifunctional diguanylate cyclase/phosphodiesterase [Haliea alexandrii]MCR9186986.1 bifunctional diguanylate cyclase/phosphodiesterase [Halieaceae bacterium]